jgi:NifU-like protein
VSFYPPKITQKFYAPERAGKASGANGVGTGASLVCGAFVRFYLRIDSSTKKIEEAKFKTSGCGYAIAAADVLASRIEGRKLTELHGLHENEFRAAIESELEKFPDARAHCLQICLDALHAAFADFRAFQLEEFAGEKALICTCFGVSEETIEKVIGENSLETVERVTDACHAGGGCGSCQFLIQEIIDVYWNEKFS